MAQTSFQLEVPITAPPAVVYNFLADMQGNQAALHPLIIAIEPIDRPDLPGESYQITDQLHWGPFRFKIKYISSLTRQPPDTLHFTARQSPGVIIQTTMQCLPHADGTLLRESYHITAPALLINYTRREAMTSHEKMWQNLQALDLSDQDILSNTNSDNPTTL